MSRHHPKRTVVATVVVGLLAIAPATFSGFGPVAVSARAAGTSVHRFSLGSKVKLSVYHFSTGPREVRVITITQGGGAFDVAPAGSTFGVYAKPSAIASKAYETANGASPAIAGTNGDFAKSGMPVHLEQIDGEIWTSGLQASPRFAINADGSRAWIGNTGLSMTGLSNGSKFTVDHWNDGTPATDEISAYTKVGGSVERPPGTNSPTSKSPTFCELRLLPTSAASWSGGSRSSITRSYVVGGGAHTNPCQQTPLKVGTVSGTVVLASRKKGTGGAFLPTLQKNDAVTLSWKSNGWDGVVDSIGGTPVLVDKGVNVGPPYGTGKNYIYNYNPRTAIGLNAACADTDVTTLCKIFLVTVDGRRPNWSSGWRMNQLGAFFVQRLHAYYALNLDGGGGTVMWAHKNAKRFAPCVRSAASGCLVNKPSDGGGERVAVMALVALPGSDLGLPKSLR
jgi:Phosphodiester glycosidase